MTKSTFLGSSAVAITDERSKQDFARILSLLAPRQPGYQLDLTFVNTIRLFFGCMTAGSAEGAILTTRQRNEGLCRSEECTFPHSGGGSDEASPKQHVVPCDHVPRLPAFGFARAFGPCG